MKKMRIFKFWNESGDEKEKEAMSLKKAVMAVQGDYKDKIIGVFRCRFWHKIDCFWRKSAKVSELSFGN